MIDGPMSNRSQVGAMVWWLRRFIHKRKMPMLVLMMVLILVAVFQSTTTMSSSKTTSTATSANSRLLQRSKQITNWIPPDKDRSNLPKVDLLLIVFADHSQNSAKRREALRHVYDAYNSVLTANTSTTGREFNISFKYLFFLSHPTTKEPYIEGDILHSTAVDGYMNLSPKVQTMISEVYGFYNFSYLMKTDDDSFLCLNRLATHIAMIPPERRGIIYGGSLKFNSKVITKKTNKWYDERFLKETLWQGGYYPPYNEGAGYIIARSLLDILYDRITALSLTSDMEDVLMGSWLMGLKREFLVMNVRHSCPCGQGSMPKMEYDRLRNQKTVIMHRCKSVEVIKKCKFRFGLC